MSVQRGPRWQPCPAWSAPAALYVSAALPSKSLKHRALPPPGTGKARHLWKHTTVQFNHCSLFMGGELDRIQKDSRAIFRDVLLTAGKLSLLCHKGFHTQPACHPIHYCLKVWELYIVHEVYSYCHVINRITEISSIFMVGEESRVFCISIYMRITIRHPFVWTTTKAETKTTGRVYRSRLWHWALWRYKDSFSTHWLVIADLLTEKHSKQVTKKRKELQNIPLCLRLQSKGLKNRVRKHCSRPSFDDHEVLSPCYL